jgi:hypothetical protein
VIVNRAMAAALFGGANPLGHRIRYIGRSREAPSRDVELNRWYEIVGVVADFPTADVVSDFSDLDIERTSRVYHVAARGDVYPATLAVRVRAGAPYSFAGRLREIGAAVDPDVQLERILSAEESVKQGEGLRRLFGVTIVLVILSVVILSAAGIYALMSFTVSRRRREVGIRTALGADPARILAGIFSRAFAQLAIGAAAGMLASIGLEQLLDGEMLQGRGAILLPIVAVFMTTVGLLAAIGPARRGLGIQPTEALRDE